MDHALARVVEVAVASALRQEVAAAGAAAARQRVCRPETLKMAT